MHEGCPPFYGNESPECPGNGIVGEGGMADEGHVEQAVAAYTGFADGKPVAANDAVAGEQEVEDAFPQDLTIFNKAFHRRAMWITRYSSRTRGLKQNG